MAEARCPRCKARAPLHTLHGRSLCAECWRNAHEVMRTPITAASLLRGMAQLLVPVGVPALFMTIAISLPSALLSQVGFPGVGIYDVLFLAIADGATLFLAFSALYGERAGVLAALREAFRAWGRLLVTAFFTELRVIFFLLLLIVPGILKWLSLGIVLPIALHEGVSGSTAIARSEHRMQGVRWPFFVAASLTAVPVAAAWAAWLWMQSYPRTTGWPSFAVDLLKPASAIPFVLVTAVLYAKTRVQHVLTEQDK